MPFVLTRARPRAIAFMLIVSVLLVSGLASGRAHASTSPDPELSVVTDLSGTAAALTSVRTAALRAAVPAAAPRILIIGTGVQRSAFPAELQRSITAPTATDATDTFGYGTLAASTIFQLLPNASVTSWAVHASDANWFLADLASLSSRLEAARGGGYDLVLLAFPPQAALDPVTYMIGYGDYGTFGRGMAMVEEALLTTRAPTKGPIVGIPADPTLRERMFSKANLKQRDAVERFAVHATLWRRALRAVDALDAAGVPVVAPSGDLTRRNGSTVLPLVTQTVYGLSALPSVITVGASYTDGAASRVSPTSGRGPTLTLGAKPDLLAPSDIMTMLPGAARLPWPDDSTRVPLQVLDWAGAGVAPSACPSVTNVYRCVLQGSSMVSAAVVGAKLAAAVAMGLPHTAAARASSDDEVLRGIAWAASTGNASVAGRAAYPWEQGAGVFTGLRGFDASKTPIPLAGASIGEVTWGVAKTRSIPLWAGGAAPSSARTSLDSFIGPDATGRAIAVPNVDATRLSTTTDGARAVITATGARAQGGIYGGSLTLNASGGGVTIPVSLTQTVPIDVHVEYAYNEFQTGGTEGERVEHASAVLFAGLPTNVGLVGEAFKNISSEAFARFGGDPTNSVIIRAATTKSRFDDPGLSPTEHGRARIPDVPPGFYRFHVLTDHAMEAEQARGRIESLGIGLATSGPEGLNQAGANLLVPSCAGNVSGPLGCASRTGEVDRSSGLCVARNTQSKVVFNVYCGEMGYAVPTAMVSRAVHLIEHDADPARSEWKTCGVDVPTDGTRLDFAGITAKAAACGGTTAPTAWSFPTGAPDCLGPTERASGSIPTDVTARYFGAGSVSLPGRNLPAAVLTYDFKLPYLNTYTTAGLSLSYAATNAIVGVRFRAGGDSTADSSNGILAIDGSGVSVTPAVSGAGARGSTYKEWSVMSANASSGQVSIIIIPTSWARSDLDPTKPVASVQLCDVALKVNTFAKQSWGASGPAHDQFFPMLDRGLLQQIDPAKSRVRPVWNGSAFTDAGAESESLHFAIQIPKNTTMDASAPHHVRSPLGGPATFTDARRWGTDAARHESVIDPAFTTHDTAGGVTSLACSETAADPAQAGVCKAWNAARAANATVAELGPDLSVNGRFAGVLAIDAAAISRAQGNISFEIADIDDSGVFDASGRWDASRRFAVGDFFDDIATPFSLSLLNGTVTVTKDATGAPVLSLATADPGGSSHLIRATLG